jgi:Domain of unknown function (DUF4349)
MRLKLAIICICALLSACSKANEQSASMPANVASDAAGTIATIAPAPPQNEMASQEKLLQGNTKQQVEKPIIANNSMLAYSYSVSFLLPKEKVTPQLRAHLDACQKAGASLCQIISSSISDNEDIKTANLSMRAEPKWLEIFRAGFEKSAQDFGGKITNSATNSEDLTRQITDNEAHLRAQTLLRTRLENILATHQGKMGDLLEAQSKLAEVQGQIDAVNSELTLAKTRIQMSELRIDYSSRQNAVSNSVFAPLFDAFTNFFAIMAQSLAFLIKTFAAILPFAIIIVPTFIWIKNSLAKRKTAKNQTT